MRNDKRAHYSKQLGLFLLVVMAEVSEANRSITTNKNNPNCLESTTGARSAEGVRNHIHAYVPDKSCKHNINLFQFFVKF